MELLIPGSWAGFSSLPKLHATKTKFSINKVFWPGKCVYPLSGYLISRTEHLNTSGITSHGTDSFCIKPITPGHPIPKISTRLTIFWGGTWKTEFVKTIHRQERTSSEEKSDGFHKKCSVELWTILMFELLLCCHTAAWCMEQTYINYWKSIVKHYWF